MECSWPRMHGQLGSEEWGAPLCVTEVDVNARHTFTDIKAHEYFEREEVLHAKVALLAQMLRRANACMAFTGAGISTAAGIDDYATKAKEESVTAEDRPRVKDWKDARPTMTHRVMAALHGAGLLKHWVQQNHDSLPQKAGYPQHCLNEIHGSLHDPANPIVPYEGSLRSDLYAWLEEWERWSPQLCLGVDRVGGAEQSSAGGTTWCLRSALPFPASTWTGSLRQRPRVLHRGGARALCS